MWKGDPYKVLFDKATASINAFWDENLSKRLIMNHPETWRLITEADRRLEKWWGKDMVEFREELVRLYYLHREVADEYKRER